MSAGYYVYRSDVGGGTPGWRGSDGTTIGHGGTPPAAARPYFGSTSTNVGTSGNAAVISKFGTGASIRIFFSTGDLTQRPPIPSGMSVAHISYKPDPATVASGSLDSQITDLINWCQPGWILTFHHEPDNNGWTSSQITDWKNCNNHLYDLAKAVKPSVLTAPVFTGGLMASYTSNSQRDTWCTGLRGDLFGVDCDGVAISSTEANYNRISYADELDNCDTYMRHPTNSGFQQITVPEHVTARVNPPDPDGSLRASWFQAQTQLMIDHNCYAVMCWDYDPSGHNTASNFNHIPAGSPELTVWKGLVANNPSTPRTP